MATLPSTDTPKTDQLSPDQDQDAAKKKLAKEFRRRIEASKSYRRKLIQNWQTNVDYRRGKPFSSQSDEDRVAVPLDWSLTEMKQSLLFSQVPAVRINHPPETQSKEIAPWLSKFESRINDMLISSGIESAMDECLPDCINAASIGIVMVSYEAITEPREVPAIDMQLLPPEIQAQILQTGMLPDGNPVPMEEIPHVVDYHYIIERISPADFLWPVSFSRSNFDKAPWIGRSGQVTWAVAKQRWNLDPKNKNKYLGGNRPGNQDSITTDIDKDGETGDEFVEFDEIYFLTHQYSPNFKSYATIHHMIFVNGQETPVVNEPWKGQQQDPETGKVVGAQRYPLRALTLTYITDEAIPPSDTAVGRSQVNEINKARTQMILQREHSIPIRTFDVNRVDPTIQYSLMRGTWQGMIPVQGVGTNIITEVARSSFPVENFKFDEIAKMDLFEIWMVGQEFSGSNVETAGESKNIAGNTNVRISRARAKVGKFFCSVAEVLGGLIAVYEDPTSFGEGFAPEVSKTLAYSILADSTVLLDSNQRLQRLMQFINFTAKSGRVEIESVLKEIATLSGLDQNVVIIPPAPKPPVEPNVSLRMTGSEDMLNPLMLAFLINSGQAPDIETIEKAKMLIQAAVMPPAVQPGLIDPMTGQPMMPPPGSDPTGGMPPSAAPMADMVGPLPQPAPPAIGQAEPNWSALDRVIGYLEDNRRIRA